MPPAQKSMVACNMDVNAQALHQNECLGPSCKPGGVFGFSEGWTPATCSSPWQNPSRSFSGFGLALPSAAEGPDSSSDVHTREDDSNRQSIVSTRVVFCMPEGDQDLRGTMHAGNARRKSSWSLESRWKAHNAGALAVF